MRTVDAQVEAERAKSVLSQTPVAVLVSAVNASLLVAVLGGGSFGYQESLWLVAVLAVGALRLGVWRAYRHDPASSANWQRWNTASIGAAALGGLLWGGGAAWLWPEGETEQLFWVFVVGGMCAGAAALHYAQLPAVLAFIGPAGLPVSIQFALEGSSRGYAASAMISVFLAALAITASRSSAMFGEYVRLRLNAAQHAQNINADNAQLRQEMEERRATEESLRQAQKMEALGQLTGGIAHDFNNLLMVVLASLSMLKKRLSTADERVNLLVDNAIQGANRGAALTQRLLAFSRRQALNPDVLQLAVLINGMADMLSRSVGPAHKLEICLPHQLPPIIADTNQLELAVLNLVVNARDSMPAGGMIQITAREHETGSGETDALAPGAYVVLSVSDNGLGMDEATLARAIEPFFTTKGVGQGTGLGLPMVHGLAAQSGGRLVLASKVGIGTTAELWLPCAGLEAAQAHRPSDVAPQPSEGPPAPRLTVLLVDDDPLVLESTSAMVEDLGHSTLQAHGAGSALAQLRASAEVSVAILDYGMPDMNGVELAAALQRLQPHLPVLLVTGYGELPDVDAAGLTRLSKPFDQAALATAILEASKQLRPKGTSG